MRLVKILFGFILILILLVAVAITYIVTMVDPNDYKEEIIALAKKHANIELAIDGDISWSFYPWLGFNVNNIAINLPDAKDENHFAKLSQAKAYIKLIPLISSKIEMSSLELSDLNLNLITYKDGSTNWENLGRPKTEDKSESTTEKDNTQSDNQDKEMKVDIDAIKIENAQVSYDDLQSGQLYEITNFNLVSNNLQLQGRAFPLAMAFTLKTPDVEMETQMDTKLAVNIGNEHYTVNDFVATVKFANEMTQNKPITFKLNTDSDFNQGKDSLDIEKLQLNFGDLSLNLSLKGQQISTNASWQGNINVSGKNIPELLATLGQDLSFKDGSALSSVSLKSNISGSNGVFLLDNLTLAVDDTTLNGKLGWQQSNSRINANLTGNTLNLDRYMGNNNSDKPATQGKNGEPGQVKSSSSQTPLPINMLKTLNFDIALALEEFQMSGAKINQLNLKSKANEGVIIIDHIKGNLYGGTFNNSGKITAQNQTMRINVNKNIENVQAEPLLKDVANVDQLVGTLNMNISVTGQGSTVEGLLSTLNGNGKLNMQEGKIKDINIAAEVCKGIALAKQEQQTEKDWPNETPFDVLDSTFIITNGVVNNDDLEISTPTLKVTGNGSFNIPASTIDYRMATTIIGDTSDEACTINEKYQNKALPLRCNGDLADLPKNCGPDINGFATLLLQVGKEKLLQDALKDVDEEEKENVKEQIKGLGVDKKLKEFGIDIDQF